MSGLYLVADDLTGALDTAAAFCGRYGPIPVHLDASHAEDDPHAAVDVGSRDDEAPSIDADPRIVARLARATIAFKKIDSRLRGHWAIETAMLMKSGAFDLCVMAPAFPAHGRTTVDGRQRIAADDPSQVVETVDVGEPLRRHGLRVAHIDRSASTDDRSFRSQGVDVLLCDAGSDRELAEIVRSVGRRSARDRPVLWCGSAGLARAIADRDVPAAPSLRGPVLTIVGSRHPAMQRQLAEAVARGLHVEAVDEHDVDATAARIGLAFERGGACALTFAFPERVSEQAAAFSIAARLRGLLPLIERPSCVIASGGRTLLAVCRAIGAGGLVVDGERSTGVPHSTIRGGGWNGVEVFSKSGGFGAPSWLVDLIDGN